MSDEVGVKGFAQVSHVLHYTAEKTQLFTDLALCLRVLKQKGNKQLPQSWSRIIIENIIVCCSIKDGH